MVFQQNELSAAQARRLVLHAQGLSAKATTPRQELTLAEQVSATVEQLGLLQIDTINYFVRSHYFPVFSRTGEYPLEAFDSHIFDAPDTRTGAEFIEYRTHELAVMPAADYSLWNWRMNAYKSSSSRAGGWAQEHPQVIQRVTELLREHGPMTAAAMAQIEKHEGSVPYWSTTRTMEKQALEVLFHTGAVVSAGRDRFQRRYGLAEQVLPSQVLNASPLSQHAAITELVRRSVRHLGIGTPADISDYFRLRRGAELQNALQELSEAGSITAVQVPEWGADATAWADTALLQHPDIDRILAETPTIDALLNPFDPLVWFRPRAERIFGFHYRIEIYVPEAKRQYGYYCLPILLDDRIVGRFDLKANRKTRQLEIRASWSEPNLVNEDIPRIALLLQAAAHWQGLETIVVTPQGNLAEALATAL